MFRLMVVLLCCFLIGCEPQEESKPVSFEERQEQLVRGIDHSVVYEDCQGLMRLRREGKLSRSTFYGDEAHTDELPESIRSLEPASVRVDEMMVSITFSSEYGTQVLRCVSNEFGEPASSGDGAKGAGFRSNPFGMDELSGTESLDQLNENYDHFQMELIPGLMYERYAAGEAVSPEEVKRSNEEMDMVMAFMDKTINELAVKKQRLLYRTDHDELLKACRQVIARYNNGAYSKIDIRDASAKDLGQIPQIILDLEPVYVWPSENCVMVALIGGLDHAGATAYLNDKEAVAGDDDLKLIDGLVYYDDGLREADDDYRDYLDSLEEKAITYLDWKRQSRGRRGD